MVRNSCLLALAVWGLLVPALAVRAFYDLAPRYLELGGSRSDLEGYLKNYIPHCRKPGDGGI